MALENNLRIGKNNSGTQHCVVNQIYTGQKNLVKDLYK